MRVKVVYFFLFLMFVFIIFFIVNVWIIVCWMDNFYYVGKVLLIGIGLIYILFDNGGRIIYRDMDILVVIVDNVFY